MIRALIRGLHFREHRQRPANPLVNDLSMPLAILSAIQGYALGENATFDVSAVRKRQKATLNFTSVALMTASVTSTPGSTALSVIKVIAEDDCEADRLVARAALSTALQGKASGRVTSTIVRIRVKRKPRQEPGKHTTHCADSTHNEQPADQQKRISPREKKRGPAL